MFFTSTVSSSDDKSNAKDKDWDSKKYLATVCREATRRNILLNSEIVFIARMPMLLRMSDHLLGWKQLINSGRDTSNESQDPGGQCGSGVLRASGTVWAAILSTVYYKDE